MNEIFHEFFVWLMGFFAISAVFLAAALVGVSLFRRRFATEASPGTQRRMAAAGLVVWAVAYFAALGPATRFLSNVLPR